MKVENVARLRKKLEHLAKMHFESEKQVKGVSVIVGYTAGYALYVHENLGARHEVGQAKYLEQPARGMAAEIARVVRTAVKNGAKLQQALYMAGLRLQRESQKLVPVDTGNLKSSAFTRKE